MADPTLELYDANGRLIAFNDDWKTRQDGSSQGSRDLRDPHSTSEGSGIGAPPEDSRGNYTAIISAQNNTAAGSVWLRFTTSNR